MTDLGTTGQQAEREYRPAQPGRWRPKWMPPAWTTLLLLAGLIFAWSYYDSRTKVPIETITIDTWVCSEPIEPDLPWNAYLRAGCTRGEVDAEVTVMFQSGDLETTSHNGSRVVVERVPFESIELGYRVVTAEPRQTILQGHSNDAAPRVTGELNGDRPNTTFTGPFRPEGGTRFLLLFGPVADPED